MRQVRNPPHRELRNVIISTKQKLVMTRLAMPPRRRLKILSAIRKKKGLRLRLDDPDGESRRSIRTGLALIKDAEKHDVLGKLSRYEASLANAVTRTLSLLHSIRASGFVTSDADEPRHR
jgi:hypothetical protein